MPPAASPAGTATELQVDHVVPIHFGGGGEDGNAAVLCDACHAAKSAGEVMVTRRLPEHFAAGTHPAGGVGGWYVRGGDGWAPAWEVGPAPTALHVLLAYRSWACLRLRGLVEAGWDDPLMRSWLDAPAPPAGADDGGAVDFEPTPFHATWGVLADLRGVDAAILMVEGSDGLLLDLTRRRRSQEAGGARSLAYRFWRREPDDSTLVTGWRLLAPGEWLNRQPPAAPGPPTALPRRQREACHPHPPVRRPALRPALVTSPVVDRQRLAG